MKPADEIKRLIDASQITPGPGADRRILGDALDHLDKRRRDKTTRPEPAVWRIIMKSRISKMAAAAAIIMAVLLGLQFYGTSSSVTWADVIQPIFNANTAILDIIIGAEEDAVPVIHDMVMGSRIRRTLSNVDAGISIIDLETRRLLSLDENKKEAAYIDLKGMPSISDYMAALRNVISKLQDSPQFVIEELGEREIDGRTVIGFRATHPKTDITIWADPDTALPVRIEQTAGQMTTIAKNLEFDVPMDEALFSMDVPEGYTLTEVELDLQSATEEDFIEGLRILAEVFGDGQFPDGVALQDHLKRAARMAEAVEDLELPEDEQMAIGMKIQQHLLFIRFFKGDGRWYYRGKGVELGAAETPIFWYRPKSSATYRVIYGDLRVEDVAPEDLPEPLDADDVAPVALGYQTWSKADFVGTQEDYWYFLADGRIRVKAYLTLLKGPQDTSVMRIGLPYPSAPLEAVLLDRQPLTFHQAGDGAYDVELPAEKLAGGEVKLLCQWHLSPSDLQEATYGYQVRLQALVPVVSYKLKVALEADSGLEFAESLASTKDPSDLWAEPFSIGNPPEPTTAFGSCGIAVQKRD